MALLKRARKRLHFWRWYLTEFHPIAGGADPPDPKDPDPKDPKDPDPKDPDPDPDPDDDTKVTPEDDWKAKSRKNETRAKRAERELEEARQKLKEREDDDKSDQEKAIDEAKAEARKEAEAEAKKERRSDRLEVAVTRLASKGIEVGEGDEKKTLRFEDPEDAQVFIERQLANEDLDEDDIFDEKGKVNTEALTKALAELLEQKPRLAADAEGRKPAGDADARKGDPAQKDLEAMSPGDHAKRKYPATATK
jgi:hypothetical protein